MNKVFEILNVESNKTREDFRKIFAKGVIPVANIFYKLILSEGYLNGKLADTGIECWRNIFNIRKDFYENSFYRFEI